MEKLNLALAALKASDGKVSAHKVGTVADTAVSASLKGKASEAAEALCRHAMSCKKEHRLAALYAIDAVLSKEVRVSCSTNPAKTHSHTHMHTEEKLPGVKRKYCLGHGAPHCGCGESAQRLDWLCCWWWSGQDAD
jgi:hypothetical protein